MRKSINQVNYGVTEYYAECIDCGRKWVLDVNGAKATKAMVKRSAKAHVINEGHTVLIKAVSVTSYMPFGKTN